ncbi:MAG TPA: translation initiation factor IF-2 [Acidimicrobiia bacterium]
MATKKIRVYELARELGVENAVVLDLANELKIGVKSHSSSIDDPSADRVRRLADSKGLRREPVVEEPEPEPAPAPPPPEPEKVPAVEKAPAPVVEPAQPEVAPPPPHRVVRSTGGLPEPAPLGPRPAPAPAPGERREEAPAAASDATAPPAPPAAPRSPSGRPIPPPPGGRPIPPPPGARPLNPSGPPRSGAPRTGGAPSGAPRGGPGGGRGAGFPRSGPGGPPSGPPGGRGGYQGRGRPGPQGQRPRRKKRRRRNFEDLGPAEHPQLTPADTPVPEGEIVVPRGITIQELAPKLNRTSADLVRVLFDAGEMVTGTQSLADEMVELIGETLGAEVLLVEPGQEEELELRALLGDDEEEEEDESLLEPRAPIVTVMGHVDHGKTTLLDRIREAHVVDSEAGGITQHIGAYQVVKNDREITFIDTPGHEAFTAMRARGAQATDIAVLVVAADDGVMPQTVEAISHAKAAEVPVIVAITKVDRADADPQRTRQGLVEQELVPEEWGGDTLVVEVSGTEGTGIPELLDAILLVADVQDPPLMANPKAPARAFVLEANLDPGRGPVASVLVERGILHVGDPVVAGGGWGKVRALFDEHGKQVADAGPSTPVEVIGLDDVPLAGDELRVAPDEKTARTVAEARARRRRTASLSHPMTLAGGARLEDIFAMVQRGEIATLNLVLKSDVQGSL